jgi:hypothetical protein
VIVRRPSLLSAILSGSVTRHRVVRKPQQFECPYRAGQWVDLQRTPGGQVVARVKVSHDRAASLADVTEEEAKAEGFERTRHRNAAGELAHYYENAWSVFDPDHRVPCWVLTWDEIDLDPTTRHLTPLAGAFPKYDAVRDYTTGEDKLEAGAVPPQASVEAYTEDAHERGDQARGAELDRLNRMPLGQRLDRVRDLAQTRGVACDQLLAGIKDRIERMERRVERGGS